MNMVLTGNPGCGKTTLARLIKRFLLAYGVLKKDVFIEANALELKGEYVGQTAPRVMSTVRSAIGGVLFLDEAYALAGENKRDCFSDEAIRTLLTEVENNRTSVMVILAGYRDKMSRLMRADPGMNRRFPNRVHLPDYTPEQLVQIAEEKASTRYNLTFGEGVQEKLQDAFKTVYASEICQHNGGLSVRLVEEAVGRNANRMDQAYQRAAKIGQTDIEEDTTLTLADFDLESHFDRIQREQEAAENSIEAERTALEQLKAEEEEAMRQETKAKQQAAIQELEGMIGFDDAKQFVRQLIRKIEFVQAGGNKKVLETCRNLVLTGSPGVGKTTFARIVHKVLHAYGVVKEDTFIERNGLQLKGQYVGQTSPKVTEAFDAAHGGTLFLDEAYALNSGNGGRGRDCFASDAIATLLTECENRRTSVMVILAGYEEPMQQLLDSDPGLRRRFPSSLNLPDYSPKELGVIADKVARERFNCQLGEGVQKGIVGLINERYMHAISKHNASLPIRMVEEALTAMADRIMCEKEACQEGNIELDLVTLQIEDFTACGKFASELS